MTIGALRFRVNDDYDALIYPVGAYEKINWENQADCALGEDFIIYSYYDNYVENSICIDDGLDGEPILRLIETKRYIIKLECLANKIVKLPILQNEDNNFLKIEKDKNLITFQYINYLGRTRVSFSSYEQNRILAFEIIPDKIDYEKDYIELTESIAEQCSELLLEYTGATSNIFSMSNEDSKTLLEQFIFIRKFCYSENLLGLFESIKRNPDRLLIDDFEFKPIGAGVLSRKVFTKPFSYTKNWHSIKIDTSCKYFSPGIVGVTKKRDSLDTVANRFLKFALERFYTICKELTKIFITSKSKNDTSQCFYEASSMLNMLEAILQDQFFEDIGRLEILPQNNQVLQKRRGYFEIFSAFLMVDLALQLDWKGKDSVYEGESKDVALLYEYWIFFELNKIVKMIDGCKVVNTKERPFISIDNNRLNIFLKQGVKSCQSFVIEHLQTRINLYYNRTFSPTDFKRTKYEGSYSRYFRPDYTIAIFPSKYYSDSDNGEKKALEAGAVSYIHFDAKYRVSDITSVFSHQKTNSDEVYEELKVEKAEEVTNTYKNADLLKMHTYNDAIRRTIGSYVLYPGEPNLSDENESIFSLYDEILPGVGAFAIKPSISGLSENKLEAFILRIIVENNKNYSRLNRMSYYKEMVLQEPNIFNGSQNVSNETFSKTLCIIGYIRSDRPEDYYYSLEKNNLLNKGKEFYFYYYAIKGDTVYSHHKNIAKAGRFRFYKNNINDSGTYDLEPVLCEILSADLMSKHTLVDKLNKQGYSTSDKNHHADFYYVMKLKVIEDSLPLESKSVKAINHINGNDSFSPHSPKVITIDNI